MLRPLSDIFRGYGSSSDKTTRHRAYLAVYERLFEPRREEVRTVVEIGIGSGGSVRAWAEYFTNATIFGIDINRDVFVIHPRVICKFGDATKLDILAGIPKPVDIVIDDGSHVTEDVLNAVRVWLPALAPGGIYVIEDVQPGAAEAILGTLPRAEIVDLTAFDTSADNVLAVYKAPMAGPDDDIIEVDARA